MELEDSASYRVYVELQHHVTKSVLKLQTTKILWEKETYAVSHVKADKLMKKDKEVILWIFRDKPQ